MDSNEEIVDNLIMGLLPLLNDETISLDEKEKINGYLIQSADELYEVIKKKSNKTEVIVLKKEIK